jgi:di/tricarboxylate transporter
LTPDAWLTAAIVLGVLAGLWFQFTTPSFLVFTAVVILLAAGVIDAEQAFSGFSNPAPITVAALFVLAEAVSKTGAIEPVVHAVMGDKGSIRRPLLRLSTSTVATSGFLANTPLVAMMIPQVTRWAKRRGADVSQFLMPLSFAAILGGTLTIIGTSTNLVVDGAMKELGLPQMGFFEIGVVGLPVAILGIGVIVLMAPRVLKGRRSTEAASIDDLRSYTIELEVVSGGPMDGKTVEDAGLRHLADVFLVSIDRGDTTIAPATPNTVLRGGNVLRLAGDISKVLELQTLPGVQLAQTESISKMNQPTAAYFTVVVGSDSPVVGNTLKEIGFRSKYQAAVVAIHRADHRIEGKLGEVVIHIGDTLVLVADPGFRDRWQHRSDFLLVAGVDDAEPPHSKGGPFVLVVMLLVIVLAALDVVPILVGSLVGAVLLVVAGTLTPDEARRAVDLEVIGLIAAAFGLAAAVEASGLAQAVSDALVDAFGGMGSLGVLLGVVLATIALTELISNNAAALLMLPIAVAAAPAAGIDPVGMALAVAMSGSASFLTPIGYQTNTMVYGPGGYRLSDYFKLGFPITAMVVGTLIVVVPVVYGV